MSKLEKITESRQNDAKCACGACNLSAFIRLHSYAKERDVLIEELKKALRDNNDGTEKYGVPA